MVLLFWYIVVFRERPGKILRRRRNQRGGLAVFIGESRFSWDITNLEVIGLTDEELLGLYFARSEEAIRATGMVYGSYCRAIALRILDSEEDAEECLADVWLRVWNAVPPERPEHFKGWLGVITRNQALTLLRSRERRPRQAALELAISLSSGPEAELEARELGQAVSAFLADQPERSRGVFLRRYWYGDTVEEAARWAGWSLSRTKSALFRMRKKLKDYLKKEGLYRG